MAFRYYDSAAGRFLNRDPIGYAGGINVYSYVTNDPTMLDDRSVNAVCIIPKSPK